MSQYADEIKQAARSLYLRKLKISEIAEDLNVPKRTLYHWADVGNWNDLIAHESAEEAIRRRITLLVEREDKTKLELKELDSLVYHLERLARLATRKNGFEDSADGSAQQDSHQGNKNSGKKNNKKRKGKIIKNDVSHLTLADFQDKFHKTYFHYQTELYENKERRNRFLLKSRQIGATWYFAQEAFEDACLTGDNQIFLSATRAQAEVFRAYIVALAQEHFDIELKGNPIVLHTAKGPATLYFLSNNSKSAQSYHGHVYIDECFWINKFSELYNVATGMAAHKKWRRTFLSTPSTINHEAYPLWSGENYNQRFKKKRAVFPTFAEMQAGAECPDNIWRKIITLEDAEKGGPKNGGCDLFDRKDLELEYARDVFLNLFMCQFVDDTFSVFKLHSLEKCGVDLDTWKDINIFDPKPVGNLPVWCGYDPSRFKDDASFVVLLPPLKEGGKFRVIEKHKWLNKSFTFQAARIKEICARYNVQFMGVDVTGPGYGVFEKVMEFYPNATAIHYSVESKNHMVLKAAEVIEESRLEWDAAQTEIAHAFMTIRKTTSSSGKIIYAARRTATTGHADVAWSVMHALSHEPIRNQSNGVIVEF
ncbi:terminase family protein [Maridesulfovibrio ferrireducens]|uniref:terminase large subunit domain-containing protein n=1 Tax=Maridesulfovibrio ferrireducens TaxID=246191 RepID=UPI001A254BFF|nr:terminase family protein [Maridesulfovibrio ferrireducens]MBI9109897.1 terminase [Maridesulfovibrio ferrireducens]